MTKKYVTLNVDGRKYTVFRSTLDRFPDCKLWENNDRVLIDDNNIFVEADLESIDCIISYMRGYDISGICEDILKKVVVDAVYFNIPELVNMIKIYSCDTSTESRDTDTHTIIMCTDKDKIISEHNYEIYDDETSLSDNCILHLDTNYDISSVSTPSTPHSRYIKIF